MNRKVNLKGKLNLYAKWPFILGLILLGMTIFGLVHGGNRVGIYMLAALIVYVIIASVLYTYMTKSVKDEMTDFAMRFSGLQQNLVQELDVPYMILNSRGRIIWMNNLMSDLVEEGSSMMIRTAFPELPVGVLKDLLSGKTDEYEGHICHSDTYYKVLVRSLEFDENIRDNKVIEIDTKADRYFSLYLYDETEVILTRKEIADQKAICGIILVDNYEEALGSIEDVRQSLLSALVDRKITKYFQNFDASVSKTEKDRFNFVVRSQYLPAMQSSKFSILDEVREINIGNQLPVTLCIGMGVNASSYAQSQEWARHALDLALGRGGDQAVIKDHDKLSYYGGKTKHVEKSTRVRARVKAHALRQVIEGRSQVVIMGHKIGDVDCIGAAIGVYRAARILNKQAYIVLNDITTSVQPILDYFIGNNEYDQDMFITSETAAGIVNNNTALIIVDVSNAARVEGPELLNLTKTVVVIDHHRQNGSAIENPVLAYIEPYASSACEMVTEILQYISDNVKLRPEEADALYAGILIDTDHFLNNTGVRTFEAAAYLRRCGADISRVRIKLRDNFKTYQAKAEAVKDAAIEEGYAYAICPSEGIKSPTVLGAEIANELLNVKDVDASFVFTEMKGTVYISARSISSLNVQLVMEKLGGGGHSTIAGAQLKGAALDEAIMKVKQVLSDMKAEGEIS